MITMNKLKNVEKLYSKNKIISLNKNKNDKYRIQGECLLISSLPGKDLRTLVEIARLVERFNMRSQSQAW